MTREKSIDRALRAVRVCLDQIPIGEVEARVHRGVLRTIHNGLTDALVVLSQQNKEAQG
jgi:hypothetical protein